MTDHVFPANDRLDRSEPALRGEDVIDLARSGEDVIAAVTIELNGAPYDVVVGTTLAELMTVLTGSTRGSAAVVDGEVVPRSAWPAFRLRDGQRVELITAVQGG
jgi:sulfur carrier protein